MEQEKTFYIAQLPVSSLHLGLLMITAVLWFPSASWSLGIRKKNVHCDTLNPARGLHDQGTHSVPMPQFLFHSGFRAGDLQ